MAQLLAAAPSSPAAAGATHPRRPATNLRPPPKTATGSASVLARSELTLAPRALGAGSSLGWNIRTRRSSSSSSIRGSGLRWQPPAVRVKAAAASRRQEGTLVPPPPAVRAAAAFALQRQPPAVRSARARARDGRDGSGSMRERGTASANADATESEIERERGSESADVGRTRMGEKTLKLYTHGLCPYAQRVSLTLVEKRVDPRETFHIDLANKPSWYYKVNPRGLVPAVDIDGIIVTESLVICRCLDDTFLHNPLMPMKDGRAKEAEIVRRLLQQSDDVICAGLAVVAGPEHRQWSVDTSGRAADHRSLRREREQWLSAVESLCNALRESGGPFLAGPSVTLADIALFPFIHRFDIALSTFRNFPLSSYNPLLSAWLERLQDRQHMTIGGGERSGKGGSSYSWAQTFPDRLKFVAALRRFKCLDYFDYHSASLADPNPI